MTITNAAKFRPTCPRIDPDADNKGYFCKSCGYDLILRGAWFRHGTEWRYPHQGVR